MLKQLIYLLVMLCMIPFCYVLFFTTFFDKMWLRLRMGRKASSITSAAHAFDRSVEETAQELAEEQKAIDAAMASVKTIQDRPVSRGLRTFKDFPYVIRNTIGTDLYWSNTLGWIADRLHADRFSAEEKKTLPLPANGRWFKPRKLSDRPVAGK